MGGYISISQKCNGVFDNNPNKVIEVNIYEYAKHVHFRCDVVAYLRHDFNDGFKKLNRYWHIEADKKWPPFRRRHLQMPFPEWKFPYFD